MGRAAAGDRVRFVQGDMTRPAMSTAGRSTSSRACSTRSATRRRTNASSPPSGRSAGTSAEAGRSSSSSCTRPRSCAAPIRGASAASRFADGRELTRMSETRSTSRRMLDARAATSSRRRRRGATSSSRRHRRTGSSPFPRCGCSRRRAGLDVRALVPAYADGRDRARHVPRPRSSRESRLVRVAVIVTEVGRGIGGRFTFQEMLVAAVERLRDETRTSSSSTTRATTATRRARLGWRARRLATVGTTLALRAVHDVQDALVGTRLVHIPNAARAHGSPPTGSTSFGSRRTSRTSTCPFVCQVFDLEHRMKPWFPEVSAARRVGAPRAPLPALPPEGDAGDRRRRDRTRAGRPLLRRRARELPAPEASDARLRARGGAGGAAAAGARSAGAGSSPRTSSTRRSSGRTRTMPPCSTRSRSCGRAARRCRSCSSARTRASWSTCARRSESAASATRSTSSATSRRTSSSASTSTRTRSSTSAASAPRTCRRSRRSRSAVPRSSPNVPGAAEQLGDAALVVDAERSLRRRGCHPASRAAGRDGSGSSRRASTRGRLDGGRLPPRPDRLPRRVRAGAQALGLRRGAISSARVPAPALRRRPSASPPWAPCSGSRTRGRRGRLRERMLLHALRQHYASRLQARLATGPTSRPTSSTTASARSTSRSARPRAGRTRGCRAFFAAEVIRDGDTLLDIGMRRRLLHRPLPRAPLPGGRRARRRPGRDRDRQARERRCERPLSARRRGRGYRSRASATT